MTADPDDIDVFHPVAKEIILRLRANPARSPDTPLLMDLTVQHGRCGTGSGPCDDGGHAAYTGCYDLHRIAEHLAIIPANWRYQT